MVGNSSQRLDEYEIASHLMETATDGVTVTIWTFFQCYLFPSVVEIAQLRMKFAIYSWAVGSCLRVDFGIHDYESEIVNCGQSHHVLPPQVPCTITQMMLLV